MGPVFKPAASASWSGGNRLLRVSSHTKDVACIGIPPTQILVFSQYLERKAKPLQEISQVLDEASKRPA
jgi:hypothetical protein